MKRLGLLFLAVVLVLGVAGCNKDKDADPVGTWSVYGDDGCNVSVNRGGVWHIFDNKTFIDNDGFSGTWSVSDNDITLNYSVGVLVFTGQVDDAFISGTYTGSYSGCWTAQRTSTTP